MIEGIVFSVISVLVLIGVAFLAAFWSHEDSWYDEHLKRMWKDTKSDQGHS